MKNYILAAIVLVFFTVFALSFFAAKNSKEEGYLRIHIRANSNSEADQNVKYMVKESVSEFLTNLVIDCESANEAMKIVNANLNGISAVASQTLLENGFKYSAKAKLTEEYFPTRSYDTLVLKNGLYDALIVELGTAQGDNWWCVVYPPLCFQNNGGKNDIKSIIGGLFKK